MQDASAKPEITAINGYILMVDGREWWCMVAWYDDSFMMGFYSQTWRLCFSHRKAMHLQLTRPNLTAAVPQEMLAPFLKQMEALKFGKSVPGAKSSGRKVGPPECLFIFVTCCNHPCIWFDSFLLVLSNRPFGTSNEDFQIDQQP